MASSSLTEETSRCGVAPSKHDIWTVDPGINQRQIDGCEIRDGLQGSRSIIIELTQT